MKTCPACNRVYEDSLRFCLEDGTTLARTDQSAAATMTMPGPAAFQPPPPPPMAAPAIQPSMSVMQSLAKIFFAPGRVFESFRDVTTFVPALVRVLAAAAILIVALVGYNALYLARIGSENIARASIAVSPRLNELPAEQRERAIQMQQTPAMQAFALVMRFGLLIALILVSLPLGALIYWAGALLFKGRIAYMQALMVWTYSGLPPTVIWALANAIVLLIHPPTTSMAILTGTVGVIPANLGALFNVATWPIPVYVVALGALDLFAFYGLALASTGLRKVARIHWIGALVIVLFVWLIGVGWRIGSAGIVSAVMK